MYPHDIFREHKSEAFGGECISKLFKDSGFILTFLPHVSLQSCTNNDPIIKTNFVFNFFFIHTLFCLKKLIQIFESYARLTFSFVQILSIFSTSKVLEEILP